MSISNTDTCISATASSAKPASYPCIQAHARHCDAMQGGVIKIHGALQARPSSCSMADGRQAPAISIMLSGLFGGSCVGVLAAVIADIDCTTLDTPSSVADSSAGINKVL